jgi:hypothetical protein
MRRNHNWTLVITGFDPFIFGPVSPPQMQIDSMLLAVGETLRSGLVDCRLLRCCFERADARKHELL